MTPVNLSARPGVRLALALIAALALILPPTATVRAQDPVARFDEFAQKAMRSGRSPGWASRS